MSTEVWITDPAAAVCPSAFAGLKTFLCSTIAAGACLHAAAAAVAVLLGIVVVTAVLAGDAARWAVPGVLAVLVAAALVAFQVWRRER